jgi:hypothetical protein
MQDFLLLQLRTPIRTQKAIFYLWISSFHVRPSSLLHFQLNKLSLAPACFHIMPPREPRAKSSRSSHSAAAAPATSANILADTPTAVVPDPVLDMATALEHLESGKLTFQASGGQSK